MYALLSKGSYTNWRNVTRKRKRSALATKTLALSPPLTSSVPSAEGTATRALAYTAVAQYVAAAPRIDKGAQALSLETLPTNQPTTKLTYLLTKVGLSTV